MTTQLIELTDAKMSHKFLLPVASIRIVLPGRGDYSNVVLSDGSEIEVKETLRQIYTLANHE